MEEIKIEKALKWITINYIVVLVGIVTGILCKVTPLFAIITAPIVAYGFVSFILPIGTIVIAIKEIIKKNMIKQNVIAIILAIIYEVGYWIFIAGAMNY